MRNDIDKLLSDLERRAGIQKPKPRRRGPHAYAFTGCILVAALCLGMGWIDGVEAAATDWLILVLAGATLVSLILGG